MARDVYLSLGTNTGDRERNLRTALELLEPEAHVTAVSSLYETDPVGVLDQPKFLNLALRACTNFSPDDLLTYVKEIERRMGRVHTYRWGPRVIDIDIVLYAHDSIDTPLLTVPHPEMAGRAFVLEPLAEIAPDVRHPGLHLTIRELRDRLGQDQGVVRYGASNRSSDQGSPSR